MSLKSDDFDIRDVRMHLFQGGNGDYYLNLFQFNKNMYNEKGELVQLNDSTSIRISMSGGNAHHDIKMAVFRLWEAMEKHGKNIHPLDE